MDNHQPIKDRFKDKIAIITGGTAGIGLATARQLGLEGAKVLITGLPDDGQDAITDLQNEGIQALTLLGDMANGDFCQQVVETAISQWGGVDYLVNNAFSFIAKGLDATRQDWRYSFEVGPFGYAAMIQRVSKSMQQRNGGAIVNISSISGAVAQTHRWTYNCAKGAVNQLTRCAALDLAPAGIRVNSISPGWIWTREVEKAARGDRQKYDPIWGSYHMFRRLGEPIECARAILFLLSDDASFITGTDLPVDGGYQSMGPEAHGDTAVVAGTK
ncbi:MAG: SDR family oxidoreductase [Phycisphaeraceae bacterium]|nr:SDR family oxidoreductase [Phycisphaeraceae bacterium]